MDTASNGVNQFRKLDWRDTTLRHMRCKGGAMSFTMTEHVAVSATVEGTTTHTVQGAAANLVEVVAVAITGLTYLSVSLAPYNNGRYGAFEKPITLGSAAGAQQLLEFEGKMHNNPFSKTPGDSFWVAIDFAAAGVEVTRTGRFISAANASSAID